MKTILLLLAFTASLSSCIMPVQPVAQSGRGVQYHGYSSLPADFEGDTYIHQGRYYSGGRYETGSFKDHGQSYSSRYVYSGTSYYGGRMEKQVSHTGPRPPHRASKTIKASLPPVKSPYSSEQ